MVKPQQNKLTCVKNYKFDNEKDHYETRKDDHIYYR